jgi:carbamoyl-phosphate synthase large subunit
MTLNVLLTSVGRRVELVRAFRRAYDTLGLKGIIIGLDIDPLAPALQVVDKYLLVPRLDSPEYVPALETICRQEQIHLIFPLIDPDIPVLAEAAPRLAQTGARAVVVEPEIAQLTRDKWLTARFFERIGVPTPATWLPEHLAGQEIKYPLFIKPRFGSAAKHTYRINHQAEFDFFIQYVPSPILQEFIDGIEITNDVVSDFNGHVMGVVSRQRIEVRWGEVAKGVTCYYPQVTEACIKIANALRAVGPITVQCLMTGDKLYFTEINARFGGGVPLGVAAGADSPRWLLARAAGIPIQIPASPAYQIGLYMTRFDDSFFLSLDEQNESHSHSVSEDRWLPTPQ